MAARAPVAPLETGTLTNTAVVSSAVPDLDRSNDQARAATAVATGQTKVDVDIDASRTALAPGETTRLTLSVDAD